MPVPPNERLPRVETCMNEELKCEFIVLAYVSDPLQKSLSPVAVIGRELGSGNTRRLLLHVATVLQTVASKRHLDYLHDLFESWREVAGDGIDILFQEIGELSSGPLRAISSGFCSINDLPRVVGHVFRLPDETNGLTEQEH
jgi:hypothetical protein